MSTLAHEPGRTAYEARFAGEKFSDKGHGLRGAVSSWADLPPEACMIWAKVEEAVRVAAGMPAATYDQRSESDA